ncbi:MAG: hypothetical protein DIZ80_06645 [endosymbiont of Galathealinum brachiosum]|uniref:Cytochrome oxidase assembly protein n=1 Tax=endosymbiont of Galathealinum brachiosum TaxID=2200906 RepID=A0A370DFY1_9GAMM|nr:MAG: hypothetical protein DIZ80_06645 [endosymbiont of Galathealinum brachiosum]
MTNETAAQPQRSNMSLWVLTASFFIPAILAYGYFYLGDRPAVKSNGNLIIPIVDIHTLGMTGKSGAALSEEELTPHWRLLYFVGSKCDSQCEQTLYTMRQTIIGMGKYQDRVNYGIVLTGDTDKTFTDLIEKEHQNAGLLYTSAKAVSTISALEKDPENMQSIYLVDPLGNIMMYFPKELDPKLMRKDFNKLLKVSRLR